MIVFRTYTQVPIQLQTSITLSASWCSYSEFLSIDVNAFSLFHFIFVVFPLSYFCFSFSLLIFTTFELVTSLNDQEFQVLRPNPELCTDYGAGMGGLVYSVVRCFVVVCFTNDSGNIYSGQRKRCIFPGSWRTQWGKLHDKSSVGTYAVGVKTFSTSVHPIKEQNYVAEPPSRFWFGLLQRVRIFCGCRSDWLVMASLCRLHIDLVALHFEAKTCILNIIWIRLNILWYLRVTTTQKCERFRHVSILKTTFLFGLVSGLQSWSCTEEDNDRCFFTNADMFRVSTSMQVQFGLLSMPRRHVKGFSSNWYRTWRRISIDCCSFHNLRLPSSSWQSRTGYSCLLWLMPECPLKAWASSRIFRNQVSMLGLRLPAFNEPKRSMA